MIRKQVWRYYCEFCGKSNCSASSISRHEKRCTMNPERYCGMCATQDVQQHGMDELLAILADITVVEKTDGLLPEMITLQVVGPVEVAIDKLYEVTESCPACILAALRQKGIPVPLTKFNFSEAVNQFWANVNEANAENSYY